MVKLKIIRNKKNNQLFVSLPRRKFGLKKDNAPKFIDIEKAKFGMEDLKALMLKKKKNGNR